MNNSKIILIAIVFLFGLSASITKMSYAQDEGELKWNSFQGGTGSDNTNAIAVDGSGNIYSAGKSNAAWGSPVRAYSGGDDAYVTKSYSNGTLAWLTFLGGNTGLLNDYAYGIAVDDVGNLYVIGHSIATWGSPLRAFSGDWDVFVAKLDSNGNLLWNTFLGGNEYDNGNSISVDVNGNIYVSGNSQTSWGLPLRAFTTSNGNADAFAAKLSNNGTLIWHTFLGGTGIDIGTSISSDGDGNAYVGGYSKTAWGTSPVRAFTSSGSNSDGFIAKLSNAGLILWHTFLGDTARDEINGLALDEDGNIYAGGQSSSTWGSPVRAFSSAAANSDGFAAKLNNSGSLIWNTFVGGNGSDYNDAIALDNQGTVYVAGASNATWGNPVRAYNGNLSGSVSAINSDGSLEWNTFQGSTGWAISFGIATDGRDVFAAGYSTANWGIPLRSYTSGTDGWIAKLGGKVYNYKISIASGNWNNAAIWNPSAIPTASDSVVIAPGHNVTLDVNGICGVLDLQGTLTYSNNENRTLSVTTSSGQTGNVYLAAGANFNSSNYTGQAVYIAGSLYSTGSINNSEPAVNSLKWQFNGTGLKSISTNGSSDDLGILEVNGEGLTLVLHSNVEVSEGLTITSGTLDLQNYTANRSSAGGSMVVANEAILKIGSTNSFPANYNSNSISTTSTIDYSGSNQTVLNLNYGILSLSGSGIKTFSAGTIGIAKDLIVKDLAVVDAITYNDTIDYNGGIEKSVRYGFINKNVRISDNTSISSEVDLIVTNSLVVSKGSSLNMTDKALSVDSVFINDGDYISTNPAGSLSFYSRVSGDFGSLDSWSNTDFNGSSTVRLPGAVKNDIVIIGNDKSISLTANQDNLGTVRVDSSGTLNTANYSLQGKGKFDLRNNGKLIITSQDGLNSTTGNIQMDNQKFNQLAIYEFNGTASQVTGIDFPSEVGGLIVNNPSGVSLSNNALLSNELSLFQSNLILGDKNLTLGSSTSVSGTPSTSNMIVIDGSGELRKEFTAAGSFTFPIGDTTGTADYSPVTLSFTSGSFSNAYAGVRVVNAKHPQNGSSEHFINRYWSVNSSGISDFSCDVTCIYSDTDLPANADESMILTGKYDTDFWTLLNPANSLENKLSGTVSNFSDFTGGESNALTDIKVVNDATPINFELFQNYPNPFNPSTRIKYAITEQSFITIKVYNILGSEVATLLNENQPAGIYEVNFDGSGLASGAYIYKIQAGNFTSTKKMVLTK